MPKDKNNGREMTPDEKFRSFFSTTAVDIPEEMTRRDENQPEEKPQKRFGLFARGKVAVWEQEVKMKGRFEQ